jgi:integrase
MGEIRQRGKVWWIRYYRNGKRHEESSGSDKKQAAIDLLRIREGDVAKGLPVSAASARLRFDDAVDDVSTDYKINGKRFVVNVDGRIKNHLLPYFGGGKWRTSPRPKCERTRERQEAGASNASINRDLAIVKRAFRLAMQAGKILHRPHIPMLQEHNVRKGFFERQAFVDVRAKLAIELRGVVTFAYLTGWRIPSEVLKLQWAQIDRKAKTIRLEPGQTKNAEGRTLPYELLPDLAKVIEKQWREHERLKKSAVICPHVFHRVGQPIKAFRGAWANACKSAGVPGMLLHDLRHTAVRNLVRPVSPSGRPCR